MDKQINIRRCSSDVRSTHYEDQKIRVLSCEGKLLFLIMSVALVSGATNNTNWKHGFQTLECVSNQIAAVTAMKKPNARMNICRFETNYGRAIFMEYGQETGEGHILCLSCDRTYFCSSIVLMSQLDEHTHKHLALSLQGMVKSDG